MKPSERISKAILLLEIRLPITISKKGATRDIYLLLLKGIEPSGWAYVRRYGKKPRIKKVKRPVIVTSKLIEKRFGIKV